MPRLLVALFVLVPIIPALLIALVDHNVTLAEGLILVGTILAALGVVIGVRRWMYEWIMRMYPTSRSRQVNDRMRPK